jgi:hypothetical protein
MGSTAREPADLMARSPPKATIESISGLAK